MLCFQSAVKAQVFVELPKQGYGMANANAAWVRLNGKLSPIVSGETKSGTSAIKTILLKQTAKNTFNQTKTRIPDFIHGGMDVADFNKDGLEDVVITGLGANNQAISGIYLQQTDGNFQNSKLNLPALIDGSVQFGDYDNDDDLDVLICGRDASGNLHTKIFRNDNGRLIDINAKLPGIRFGAAKWGDVNNDGLLDALIVGQSAAKVITKIYLYKNGNYGALEQQFQGLKHADAAWADFNNDGFLDFVVAGETHHGMPYTNYFLGSKNTVFTEASPRNLRQLMYASVDVGDFNGDQFIDIVLTGESLERPYTIVYENQKGKGFRDIVAGLPGVSNGTAKWGDYDRDGDLDLFVAGADVCFQLVGSIFRNTLNLARESDFEEQFVESAPIDFSRGPYYYFVFSTCYCDPEGLGKKSYNAFVSNIHKETVDFELTYKFNDLLIKRFPGWNWSDRGHRTSNAFVSIKDAEEGRKTVLESYSKDNYKIFYLNW